MSYFSELWIDAQGKHANKLLQVVPEPLRESLAAALRLKQPLCLRLEDDGHGWVISIRESGYVHVVVKLRRRMSYKQVREFEAEHRLHAFPQLKFWPQTADKTAQRFIDRNVGAGERWDKR